MPDPWRAAQMKPNFALNLSHEGISILHRTKIGWMCVGDVSLDDPALSDQLAVLRKTAADLESGGVTTKLVIPNSQILYTEVHAPGPNTKAQIVQIRHGLEGKTPYSVEDLVFDWRSNGQSAQVAVVSRESLKEAEAFAIQHGFNPVSFVAIPEYDSFDGEPFFGPTEHSKSLLDYGDQVEPDAGQMIVLGSGRPNGKSTEHPIEVDAPDRQRDSLASQRSNQPARSGNGSQPLTTEPAPGDGQFGHRQVTAHQPWADGGGAVSLTVRENQGLTRMPITSSRIVDPGDRRDSTGSAERRSEGHKPHSARSGQGTPSDLPGRYGKLGPASSNTGPGQGRFEFGHKRPDDSRRLSHLMIILLTLILVIAMCVGLVLWLSPGQIETKSSRFWQLEDSPQTASDSLTPALNDHESLQAPGEVTSVRAITGSFPAHSDTEVLITGIPRNLPDASQSPPPDRILQAPPSLAESERTYALTGIWPLDPDRPSTMTGNGHMGDIYVPSVDRIALPQISATGPDNSILATGPDLSQAPTRMKTDEFATYWLGMVDDVPTGSSEHGLNAPDHLDYAATTPGATAIPSQLAPTQIALTESNPVPRSNVQSSASPKGPLETRLDDGQLRSPEDGTATKSAGQSPVPELESPADVSRLAAAVSPRPTARPKGLGLASIHPQSVAGNRSGASMPNRQTGTVSSGKSQSTPTNAPAAKAATQRDAISLARINLIGTFGSTGDRHALVRLRSGRFIKNIEVGDRLDGGRVTAIGAGELHYVKNNRSITLRLPAD